MPGEPPSPTSSESPRPTEFDSKPDEETPIILTPRGGAQEVGRSCLQVDTEFGTYLIDAGLNQGAGEQFPDLRGLSPGDVDAVFLTHAHVDHCGALPVLENRSLFADSAPVVATAPTVQIAQMMLLDSLKIHRRESRAPGNRQQFTRADVDGVFNRLTTVGYESFAAEDHAAVEELEPLRVRFGQAAHLLGSAWISLQTRGYRTVISGDIGGRAPHLPSIESPPGGDLLVTESTYGGTHTHRSMSDAQNDLFEAVKRGINDGRPTLIPTFSVGRAQLIMLTLNDRLQGLSDRLNRDARLVLDGMAQRATTLFHTHVTDAEYVDKSIVNRAVESGQDEPFLVAGTVQPDSDDDREELLAEYKAAGEGAVPIVVSPSGMLSGGHSPRYLAEFVGRYDDAQIVLTGYQAVGTAGRALQSAANAGGEKATVTVDTEPFGEDWPTSPAVSWESGDSGETNTRVTVPADWVETIDGLSGHAAQNTLVHFARDIEPSTIALVHGPGHAQTALQGHLADNVASADQVTRAKVGAPIPVTRDPDLGAGTVSTSEDTPERETLDDRLEYLREMVEQLSEEVATVRNDTGPTEADVRAVVQDELRRIVAEAEQNSDDFQTALRRDDWQNDGERTGDPTDN